jgi:WD40 repeat protein
MADKTTSGRARACAYSPDGVYLAVSFGCGAKNKQNKKLAEDGMIRIYRQGSDPANPALPTLVKVSELKEAKQWISVLKFSPDGNTLAAGSRDNSIYLYSVSQMFKRKAKFSKHNAGKLTTVELSALLTYFDLCFSFQELINWISVRMADIYRVVAPAMKFCSVRSTQEPRSLTEPLNSSVCTFACKIFDS